MIPTHCHPPTGRGLSGAQRPPRRRAALAASWAGGGDASRQDHPQPLSAALLLKPTEQSAEDRTH
eukprot:577790-Hanusia_phi.AAC.1